MNSIELLSEIKGSLQKMGWSQKKFAEEFYMATKAYKDEEDIARFSEKVKKQLRRDTTGSDLLRGYLDFIVVQPDYLAVNMLAPSFADSGELPDAVVSGLKKLSINLDKRFGDESGKI